jgi:hypothetical protein
MKTFRELLDASSIGQGLQDIKERGIAAHLKDLEQEMKASISKRRARSKHPMG